MYEYVSKKEYTPIRIEIENIIKQVQKILKEEERDQTFQFMLVGSGGRHLITRIKGGNSGYDFDYNLVMNDKYDWKPMVRESFFKAIQKAMIGTNFNVIENSTSVITIKQVSKRDKKIIAGCDFSIVQYPEDNNLGYYMYSRFNKKQNNYTWEIRDVSRFNDEKLVWLKETYSNAWECIRKEYLKLKNNNQDINKHSFVLYHEAINNIYHQCKLD